MYLPAILLSLTALPPAVVPAALAATKPPKYFVLQAKTIEGVTDTNHFNNRYLSTYIVSEKLQPGVFHKSNSAAQFLSLKNPDTTDNGTFYTLDTYPGFPKSLTAQMAFKTEAFANWQPVNFRKTTDASPTKEQNGFYLTSTGNEQYLEWTNKPGKSSAGDFQGWLGVYTTSACVAVWANSYFH